MYQRQRLSIISHLPEFENLVFRSRDLKGEAKIGAFGEEPYGIRLDNHDALPIEVRLSIDGTDILTGEPATTSGVGQKWYVKPHETLELAAWQETSRQGGRFVFRSADKSVAVHTHGVTSSVGYIAAAIFVESAPPPQVSRQRTNATYGGRGGGYKGPQTFGGDALEGFGLEEPTRGGLESVPGTGVGEQITQHVTKVRGLRKPEFASLLRLKYMWWDDLVAELRAAGVPSDGPPPARPLPRGIPGFPGNDEVRGVDLGSTPRPSGTVRTMASIAGYPPAESVYHRFVY